MKYIIAILFSMATISVNAQFGDVLKKATTKDTSKTKSSNVFDKVKSVATTRVKREDSLKKRNLIISKYYDALRAGMNIQRFC